MLNKILGFFGWHLIRLVELMDMEDQLEEAHLIRLALEKEKMLLEKELFVEKKHQECMKAKNQALVDAKKKALK
jgi:hypothetical protein